MAVDSVTTVPLLESARLLLQAALPGVAPLAPEAYGIGLVSVTQGSKLVQGINTNWVEGLASTLPAQLRYFSLRGEAEPLYKVVAVKSATELELSVPYAGPTTYSFPYSLWFSTPDGHGESYESTLGVVLPLTPMSLLREQEATINHNLALLDEALYRRFVLGVQP